MVCVAGAITFEDAIALQKMQLTGNKIRFSREICARFSCGDTEATSFYMARNTLIRGVVQSIFLVRKNPRSKQ